MQTTKAASAEINDAVIVGFIGLPSIYFYNLQLTCNLRLFLLTSGWYSSPPPRVFKTKNVKSVFNFTTNLLITCL